MNMNILIVGAEGTGKSLLMKRLQLIFTNGPTVLFKTTPSTIPTVGNNIANVIIEKCEVELREVGGSMAPLWKDYYSDASCVIFVVDKSNQFQFSASCILLLTLLSNEKLKNKKVLVLFNKADFPCDFGMTQIKHIFRLDDIMESTTQDIEIVECSCMDKTGFDKIVKWLNETIKMLAEQEYENE